MTATFGPLTAASRGISQGNGSKSRRHKSRSSSRRHKSILDGIKNWRHLRTFLFCAFCCIVVLDSLFTPDLNPVVDYAKNNGVNNMMIDEDLEEDERGFILDIEYQSLIAELDDNLLEQSHGFGGDDYDLNYMTAQEKYDRGIQSVAYSDSDHIFHHLIDSNEQLPSYTIEDAIYASQIYYDSIAILVYDPEDDKFVLLYSLRHVWNTASRKLVATLQNLAVMLRRLFPERFRGKHSDEFAVAISSGDCPHVKVTDCLRDQRNDEPCAEPFMTKGPILQFGSVFVKMNMYPNMVAMPMPERSHLVCMRQYSNNGQVCSELGKDLVYGDELGLEWNDLIPQVVWRGTDFGYLGNIYTDWEQPKYRDLVRGELSADFRFRGKVPENRFAKNRAAMTTLEKNYSKLVPRWQGVVLTALAKRDTERARANGEDAIPWVDIKFSNYVNDQGLKVETQGSVDYREWEQIGMPVAGEYMDLNSAAKFKYHIDLAGGGGTTWTGTLQKLALPGLLFHHITPTKDYIHDYMIPWVHYIPVASDLRDLKKKFEWAESHPVEAKTISDRGTELARYLTSLEGFERMYGEDLVEPLRRVIEAYKPTEKAFGVANWRQIVNAMDGETIKPIMKCYGRKLGDCVELVGKNVFGGYIARRYGTLTKEE